MKPRSLSIMVEIQENTQPATEVKRLVERRLGDSLILSGEIRRVQVNVVDATRGAAKKASRRKK